MSAKPIIVTGGAGFIGSNCVAALNARGEDEIIVVDHLGTSEKWRNLRGLRFEDYIEKDAFTAALETGKLPEARAILHLGACSATTERDASYLVQNNYRFTRRLTEWALATGARMVLASSAATYGDGAQGYSDDDVTTPSLRPLNMYGHSKHMFDLWALKHGLYQTPPTADAPERGIAGLKFFNVYGPGEAHKGDMRSVVHKAHRQILDTGEVALFKSHRPDYKDGEQLRDFVYVKDAVEVMLFFMDHPEKRGLFNCGTGQARTWVDLMRALFTAMDREPNIRFIDMPGHLRGKYQYYTQADPAKLRAAGYGREFMSVEDGVRDYVTHLDAETSE